MASQGSAARGAEASSALDTGASPRSVLAAREALGPAPLSAYDGESSSALDAAKSLAPGREPRSALAAREMLGPAALSTYGAEASSALAVSSVGGSDSAAAHDVRRSSALAVSSLAGPDVVAAHDSAAPSALVASPTTASRRITQAARLTFLALALAAAAYAVTTQWARIRTGFHDLGPLPLLAALIPATASAAAMMLAWRGLLASLGSPLPRRAAARVFFVSQLGKYLPGSLWPLVAQMQLGRAHRIPRARSAASTALAILVSLTTALLLAAAALPFAVGHGAHTTAGHSWAFAAVPLLLAALHPRIANPFLKTLFAKTKRPAIDLLTARTIAAAAARTLLGWLLAGLHIWILATALGAPLARTLLLATGGYAFAWSVGFLVVLAPAGAGVRELILIATLQPVLGTAHATVVALGSRLVTILADLLAAALSAATRSR